MLDKARISLQKTENLKAQKIINGAVEIAKDSALYARTQLLQTEFFIVNNQIELASNKISKVENLIPANSLSEIRLKLLQAELYIRKNKYIEADQVLNKAKSIAQLETELSLKTQLMFLRAQLNLETNNLYETVNGFREVLPNLEREQLQYYRAQATLGLATAYFKKQELDEANAATNEALKISKDFGFVLTELRIYSLKASIARGQGDFEKGLEFMDRYLELKDKESINLKSDDNNTVTVNNQEIESLNKQLALKQKDLDRHDYTNIMFFILLTLLSLLTMSLFKNNKFRLRANKTLVVKNKSLIEERDRAQDAAKIKADFLSTITHELRTPMYAVTGLTHLLLENKPRTNQKEHLENSQFQLHY